MTETTQLMERPEVSLTCMTCTLDEQLQQFKGRPDPRAAVLEYVKRQAARAGSQLVPGRTDPVDLSKGVNQKILQPVSSYLSLIMRIGEAMSDQIRKEFSSEQVRIAQVRASFDFRSWLVRVMFVIDAEADEELRIAQMLHQLESIVLHSDSFAAELDYVNKRTGVLDFNSLRSRYPFVAKVKPRA
jgi:hypothetical protein